MRSKAVWTLAMLLLSSRVHAQELKRPSTPIKLTIAASWFGAVTLDVMTDHYAVTRANAIEGNPIMPQSVSGRYALAYIGAGLGTAATIHLWAKHQRMAILLTVGDVIARGLVAKHNLDVGNRR